MVTLNSNIATAPGVYVSENTVGVIPARLASFNRAYMLGTGSSGPYNIPTQVITAEDFTNQFGSSTSLNAVDLFFKNHPNGILYFVRCASPQIAELDIGSVAAGNYTVTIEGTAIATTAVGTETPQALINQIISNINTNPTVSAVVFAYDPASGDTKFRIKGRDEDDTFTITATDPSSTSILDDDDITSSGKDDFIYACENAFDPDEHDQGFLIAPEAFQSLSSQSDRTDVATSMENLCATEGFDWLALADAGNTIDTPALAQAEAANYSTVRGHLAYFWPYVDLISDGDGANYTPASSAVAAIGLRRYENEGFQEPPAGVPYALRGVRGVEYRVTKSQQAVLNPLGINVVRYLPNRGTVVYGSRTLSGSDFYQFINVRVILNVLIGTLRTAFDSVIFTAVDGQGVLFTRIRETANAICYRLWQGGALYGATPGAAFFCKCDTENNPELDLEAGIVRLDVYVVPVPTLERLLISVNRTAIGQVEIVARQI